MNLSQFIAYAESAAVSAFEKTVVAVLKHLVAHVAVDASAPVANVVPADEPAPAPAPAELPEGVQNNA